MDLTRARTSSGGDRHMTDARPDRPTATDGSTAPAARPRVVCHMMASVDGRIVVDGWPLADVERAEYERVHDSYGADAWLVGRVTLERHFAAGVRSDAETAAWDTILNLFDDPVSVQGLTEWDVSYLTSLYEIQGSPVLRLNPRGQTGVIAADMFRDRRDAAGAAPAQEPSGED